MHIHFASFRQLDTATLYELMKLRVDVFVVEQACPYPELDGLDTDPGTRHVLGYCNDAIAAYARILNLPCTDDCQQSSPPAEPIRLGRVLVKQSCRSSGYATLLLKTAIDYIRCRHPGCSIELAAQVKICKLYQALGFRFISDTYLEDGIAHVDMRL